MADPAKHISVAFYRTSTGAEPVREWLLSLPDVDRKSIGVDIRSVEYGWPIGMPTCRSLQNGLWEVRSNLESHRISRVVFCIAESKMVLLHGFIKKTQKTPKKEIDLALARKKDGNL
jgi:phage-related protein